MKDAAPQQEQEEKFLVITPADAEPFSDRDKASAWALAVVLGGFAPWASVSGADGPICRIIGPDMRRENWQEMLQ